MTNVSWWGEQCPDRAAGLTHAHWSKCNPESMHPSDGTPMTGRTHTAQMCCHCELTEEMSREMAIAMLSVGDRDAAVAAAAPAAPSPDDQQLGSCAMDHTSIKARQVVDDDGLRWVSCVLCGDQIEGKMATGRVDGPFIGKGRGDLTKRQTAQLERIAMSFDFLNWIEAGKPPVAEWLDKQPRLA